DGGLVAEEEVRIDPSVVYPYSEVVERSGRVLIRELRFKILVIVNKIQACQTVFFILRDLERDVFPAALGTKPKRVMLAVAVGITFRESLYDCSQFIIVRRNLESKIVQPVLTDKEGDVIEFLR